MCDTSTSTPCESKKRSAQEADLPAGEMGGCALPVDAITTPAARTISSGTPTSIAPTYNYSSIGSAEPGIVTAELGTPIAEGTSPTAMPACSTPAADGSSKTSSAHEVGPGVAAAAATGSAELVDEEDVSVATVAGAPAVWAVATLALEVALVVGRASPLAISGADGGAGGASEAGPCAVSSEPEPPSGTFRGVGAGSSRSNMDGAGVNGGGNGDAGETGRERTQIGAANGGLNPVVNRGVTGGVNGAGAKRATMGRGGLGAGLIASASWQNSQKITQLAAYLENCGGW